MNIIIIIIIIIILIKDTAAENTWLHFIICIYLYFSPASRGYIKTRSRSTSEKPQFNSRSLLFTWNQNRVTVDQQGNKLHTRWKIHSIEYEKLIHLPWLLVSWWKILGTIL